MARNNAFLQGNLGQAASYVTSVVEYGDKRDHTTELDFRTTLGAIAGGASLGLGKLLYTLPAGAIIVEAAHMTASIKQTQGNITADTPDVGLGTTVASGAVAVLSGTAAFENILTGQTAADCDGTATVATIANQVLVIAAAASHGVYLNVADGWAASGDAAAILSGRVVLHWRFMS